MKDITIEDWTIKTNHGEYEGNRPVLMLLHGWKGDENSMTVFTRRLARQYALFAPRGIVDAQGGYGWHTHRSGQFPRLADFSPAQDALLDLLDLLAARFPELDFHNPAWMGFSQGGALVYSLALNHPQRASAIAGLASFIPGEALPRVEHRPLTGLPVFVAHGVRDEIVPVARARQTADLLRRAGANVQYCEGHTGHNISIECIREMETFFGVRNGHPMGKEGEEV